MYSIIFPDMAVTPTVTFKARLNENTAVLGGRIIVFPTVVFREGGAYNTDTGKFTASVNGTFMFSIAFCVYIKKYFVVNIMIDGNNYSAPLIYGDDGRGCSSADTVALVTAGQDVWVEAQTGSSTGDIIYQDKYRWNTFSGILINRL
jgi:hypothetical protein